MNEGSRITECYVGLKNLARIAAEGEKDMARERVLEKSLGVSFPRCPTCGARRRNIGLGRACAYCGVVEGGVTR